MQLEPIVTGLCIISGALIAANIYLVAKVNEAATFEKFMFGVLKMQQHNNIEVVRFMKRVNKELKLGMNIDAEELSDKEAQEL